MNVTACIFASPIFKYIYYLILYQWQLYIHVRSTILFSFFFLVVVYLQVHPLSEWILYPFGKIWSTISRPWRLWFCTSEVFHSPLDVRDCFNSISAQNDSDIVAWWSGNAISRKGRPRCLGTAGPNFINSKFKNNFCETQHVFTRTTLEWVAHHFFFYQIFLIAFIN